MDAGRRARDEWLALRCQASEAGAFQALVSEVERPLFSYLSQLVGNPEQAMELLQETWIRALNSFAKLKDPSAVRSWLYSLAHGIAVDHVRRDQVRHRAEERYADESETTIEPGSCFADRD
jgi:RNA polymerase sigma-70 factor (ECF subfamily)